ncbi:MAG: SNF2 helicase associated domain-containing protein, partial [Erysipelotrichaceae bacterium]|nr:SNF2 helicase associated domain-containing protein [Erysipelotrichaceae bacterium]
MEADSYVYAEVEVGKENLLNYYCDNRRCQNSLSRFSYMFWNSGSSELCPHLLALLLLVAEYIKKYNPGDSTDYSGLRLLQNFAGRESSVLSDQEQIRHDIRLEPRLTHEGNGLLKLSFRMGNERLFNVRNLTDMVKAHDGKEEFALSTKASVDFSQNDFDAHSDRYYQLIAEAVSEENNRKLIRTRDYHAGDDSKLFNIGSSLLLYGRRLDDFYELAKDEIIELTDNAGGWKEKHEITLKKGRPEMNLTVSDVWTNRDFDGVRMEGTVPGIIQGARHGYSVTSENLVQVDSDYLQLVDMLQQGSHGDRIDVRIGRKHLPEFYHHVLPQIKNRAVVYENNRSMIEEYIPPKPEYHFYLDAAQGQITCRAMVSYGDNMYNMTDIDPALEFRDPISENRVYETLNRYFEGVSEQNELICSKEDDAIFDLLENGIPELLKLGEVQSTSAFDRLKVKRRIGLQVGVRLSNDLLELDIATEDISLEELAEVINSYRQKKKFHRLRNGEFVRIDDENVESLDELLESMSISLKDFVAGRMNIPAYRALYLDHLLEKNEYLYDHRDAYYRNLLKDFKTIRDSEYEVPESLKDVMRGYQKDGFRWLKTLDAFGFGGSLADERGLGKTVQMISLLLDHKEGGKQGTSLVVCPASLVFNWQNEFRKFAPQMQVACVTGVQNDRKNIIDAYQKYDVLITSYDLLKRDIDLYDDIVFDCEILDEAQYIKTHTTANAKACKAINAARHFALTGTPIENNLSELWSIFDFLMPGFLYGYQTFRNRFELRIAKDKNDKAADELKHMISPFILRRKKLDVLTDLPEKIEETVKVKFDAVQQRL